MPIFEFECQQCATISEEITSNREIKHSNCDVCGGVTNKIVSSVSWDIKGGGVYRHTEPERTKDIQKTGRRRINVGD